jgi:hypothetical protein
MRLFEVVTPRTNAATITAAEHLFAGMALGEPFGLEIAGEPHARRFVCRAASPTAEAHLRGLVQSAYPQAEVRPIGLLADPAHRRPAEQVLACTLELRGPLYLPIRILDDAEVDANRAAQADPLLGVLSAIGDLPSGWRAVRQLALEPAPEDWCRDFLRLAVQHPLAGEQAPRHTETSMASLGLLVALLLVVLFVYETYVLFQAGEWLSLAIRAVVTVLAGSLLPWLVRRLLTRPVYDMALVREKVRRAAFRVQLRLAVFGPPEATTNELQSRLDRLAAVHRPYNLAAGNGFVARGLRLRGPAPLADPRSLGSSARCPILNTRELAGLWHLPQAAADVPLLERTTARAFLPLPPAVARGCRLGVAEQHSQNVPVSIPDELTRRHLLLVAKTRRGKSTLLLRLATYAMAEPDPHGRDRAVVLVDPHRDLVQAALGVVPAHRRSDVVALDLSDVAHPFGLNLLDAGLSWDRDRAVANALTIFRREWDQFWGPRMEDAFRFGLLTLFEANQTMCAADPVHGRDAQHTILDLPAVLCEPPFRKAVLELVADPAVRAWWTSYFEPLERRFQLEIVNPVLTKIHRFDGSQAARLVIGQPRSTIDPTAWLRDGAVVVVNTASGTVGNGTASLVGGTLLNLVALAVAGQATLESSARRPVTLVVDEFHTIPGADYEAILAEHSKYGANLVLATQTLSRLDDPERDLRAVVFANLDGLFAFHCSAEDARYLVPELGGALDEQDLVELGEHQCYVRLSAGGRRLPTFSIRLEPPLASDAALRETLAAISAKRYGRAAALVEADRQSALARIAAARQPAPAQEVVPVARSSARNQHRPRKRRAAMPAGEADREVSHVQP